jgi:hypothetical protein
VVEKHWARQLISDEEKVETKEGIHFTEPLPRLKCHDMHTNK